MLLDASTPLAIPTNIMGEYDDSASSPVETTPPEELIQSAEAIQDMEKQSRVLQREKKKHRAVVLQALADSPSDELDLGSMVARLVEKKPLTLSRKRIEAIPWLTDDIRQKLLEEVDNHPAIVSMILKKKRSSRTRSESKRSSKKKTPERVQEDSPSPVQPPQSLSEDDEE